MAHASNTITINRRASEVYQFLADGLNNPKWRPAVVEVGLASGNRASSGAVYKQVMKGPLGASVKGDYRIIEASPDTRVRFEVIAGPARPVGQFDIEPVTGGSRVRFSLSYEPKGLMRIMSGMIQSAMNAEVEHLTRLKTVLEAT